MEFSWRWGLSHQPTHAQSWDVLCNFVPCCFLFSTLSQLSFVASWLHWQLFPDKLCTCSQQRKKKKQNPKNTESSGAKAPHPQLWFRALFSSGSSDCSFFFHFSSEKESTLRPTLLTQGDGVHYEDTKLSFDRDVSDSSPVWALPPEVQVCGF